MVDLSQLVHSSSTVLAYVVGQLHIVCREKIKCERES